MKLLIIILISCIPLSASKPLEQYREYVAHAQACAQKQDTEQALVYYHKAQLLNPNDLSTLHAIANLYRDTDRFEQALAYYGQALTLEPTHIALLFDTANTLTMLDQVDKALLLYRKILAINPTIPEVLYNYGYTLKKKGFTEQAIELYRKILTVRPEYAHVHFSLSLACLSLGKFKEGWEEYEWRGKAYNEEFKKFTQPLWIGQLLEGKTILLCAEQGLGDSFQFIRYAQLFKAEGARVIFQAQPAIKKILSLCPYLDTVIAIGEPIPHFDYYTLLMSCPLRCNTTLETIPHDIPYLYADSQLTKEWHTKLASDNHKKCIVGICWQGNAHYSTQFLRKAVAAKSMHSSLFIPLTKIPGVTVYSLQKMDGAEQLQTMHDHGIQVFEGLDEQHGRFMDTAAIIKNLDLVITIDTSIGHFAAALGTPTWIMLPNPPDWRWMLNTLETPWYPNVRLFRQKTPGDWETVINDVVVALKAFVA